MHPQTLKAAWTSELEGRRLGCVEWGGGRETVEGSGGRGRRVVGGKEKRQVASYHDRQTPRRRAHTDHAQTKCAAPREAPLSVFPPLTATHRSALLLAFLTLPNVLKTVFNPSRPPGTPFPSLQSLSFGVTRCVPVAGFATHSRAQTTPPLLQHRPTYPPHPPRHSRDCSRPLKATSYPFPSLYSLRFGDALCSRCRCCNLFQCFRQHLHCFNAISRTLVALCAPTRSQTLPTLVPHHPTLIVLLVDPVHIVCRPFHLRILFRGFVGTSL